MSREQAQQPKPDQPPGFGLGHHHQVEVVEPDEGQVRGCNLDRGDRAPRSIECNRRELVASCLERSIDRVATLGDSPGIDRRLIGRKLSDEGDIERNDRKG